MLDLNLSDFLNKKTVETDVYKQTVLWEKKCSLNSSTELPQHLLEFMWQSLVIKYEFFY